MVSNISSTAPLSAFQASAQKKPSGTGLAAAKLGKKDSVQFGQKALSTKDTQQIVLERAMERLRSVVDQARKDLNIPEGAVIDTSPDATAERILNFALGFFDRYAKNNGLNDDEDGRRQFANFIGGAITQGIDEARQILGALNALNPQVTSNIDRTAEVIRKGLDDFITRGLQR